MVHEDHDPEGPSGVEFERKLTNLEQIDIAEKLQTLLLKTYEKKLQAGTLSDTGLAALQRLLSANGWSLDPSRLPQSLKDKLTSTIDPNELDDEDIAGILPLRKPA